MILHYKLLLDFRQLARSPERITINDHRILIVFGNNLKRHGKAMGLSLRQFAALADIDHAMVDRYERGVINPSLTTVARLAEALEIEPADLLQDKKRVI